LFLQASFSLSGPGGHTSLSRWTRCPGGHTYSGSFRFISIMDSLDLNNSRGDIHSPTQLNLWCINVVNRGNVCAFGKCWTTILSDNFCRISYGSRDICGIHLVQIDIHNTLVLVDHINTSLHQYKWLDSMLSADITHVRLVFSAEEWLVLVNKYPSY
jgi:hypothetical protein